MSKKFFLLTFFLLSVFLLSACKVQDSSLDVKNSVVSQGSPLMDLSSLGSYPPAVKDFVVRDYLVYYSDGSLFPNFFYAEKGDIVRLNFLFDQVKFIDLSDFGVVTRVRNSVIEFKAFRTGDYLLSCLDCADPGQSVVISVN